MSEILVGILLIILAFVCLYKCKFGNYEELLFSKNYSNVLRAVSCIVVILVHIPEQYSNRLQDGIGSFAFVCVMIFFMLSGYGVTVSSKKQGYMKHFWWNRAVSLLIPQLIVNIFHMAISFALHEKKAIALSRLYNIDGFIIMLAACYLIFYVVFKFDCFRNKTVWAAIFITLFSILTYCFHLKIPVTVWPVPCIGFAFGIIIAEKKNRIVGLVTTDNRKWLFRTLAVGLISAVIGVLYLKYKEVEILGSYIVRIALGTAIISFVVILTSKIRLGNKCVDRLGKISYEVYLTHGLFIYLYAGLKWNISSGWFIVCVVCSTIVLSLVINLISKRLISIFRKN